MSTTTVTPSVNHKVDFNKLQVGTVISETQYYTVAKIKGNDVQLTNDTGENIIVSKGYAESCLTTADQYSEERVISRTELTQIFLSHPYTAMTVNFNKKADIKDVLAEVMNAHQNTAPKEIEKAFKAALKKGMDGEERTMIGRHYATQDEFGRIQFTDMQIARGQHRERLVDPRTLNYVIVKGVKYKTKK